MFSISSTTSATFGTTLALIGNTVQITTTASQTLTGSIDFTFDTSTTSESIEVGYALCYSSTSPPGLLEGFEGGGTPVVNFVHFTTSATSTDSSSANASGSVVPGSGTWNVGLCAYETGATGGATLQLDDETGWIMQTND